MKYPNLISATISDTDVKEIIDALNFINSKLSELTTLSHEELDALPKMQRNTINFVLENLEKAKDYPEIIPEDVNVEEIKKDVELVDAINLILNPLKKIEKKLEESTLVASSEAYLPSIAIHNAIRADQIRRKHKREKITA